jgi:hypothetical protein
MNTNYWWHDPDWRKNPCIVRSRNPLLRQAAIDLIRAYVERGDSMEQMLLSNCKWMMGSNHPRDVARCGYRSQSVIGGYLIPGNNGVRCNTRQVGVLIEYPDGRVEWEIFRLVDVYGECVHGLKPVQLRLFA